MRILVTNDDGIDSPGLEALTAALHRAGHDLLVLAPMENCTGAAGAIGPIGIPHFFDMTPRRIPSVPGIEAYGVSAYPAMCVLAAMLGAFGERPDIVFSGINEGANVGRSIIHSGTVSAALTGAIHGARALAVSINSSKPSNWEVAADIAVNSLDWLTRQAAGTMININVPKDEVKGIRSAVLAPLGQLRTSVIDGEGSQQIELNLQAGSDPADSDGVLLHHGFATVTPIIGLSNADLGMVDDLVTILDR
jgi:5'-nucleotidase